MKTMKKAVSILATLCVAFALPVGVTASADETADVTPPTLSVSDTTIRAYVGETPVINVTATDETDGAVDVSVEWSAGALDGLGYLTEGTHTCVLTATDNSDNVATVTLTYAVSVDETTYEGYAFATLICGQERTVQVLSVGAQIDMSAYGERTGYTRKVVNAYGETVTDFTADFDVTLYVTYEAVVADETPETPEKPDTPPETEKGCNATVGTAGLIALLFGAATLFARKEEK